MEGTKRKVTNRQYSPCSIWAGSSFKIEVKPGEAKFSSQAPRYASSTLVLPLTWRATDTLSAHVNWGRNFLRGGVGQPRGGVSLEWLPISDLSLVAERFREAANNSTRLGARYALTSDVKLDISRASSLHAGGVSWLTASVIWEFDR